MKKVIEYAIFSVVDLAIAAWCCTDWLGPHIYPIAIALGGLGLWMAWKAVKEWQLYKESSNGTNS